MSAIVQERSGVSLQRLAPGQDNRVGPMAGLPPPRQRPEKLYLKLWWKKTDSEGVQTIESEIIHVDEEIIRFSVLLWTKGEYEGHTEDNPLVPAVEVTKEVWAKIEAYCRFHVGGGRSDKERKKFNGELVKKCDPSLLCGLLTLAHDWDLAPLVDITAKAVARLMEGKAPEDMRELFNLADDLTEEEKLAEIKGTNDPKVRAMNALNRRKLEALQQSKAEAAARAEGRLPPQPPVEDTRSLEELLAEIEGGGKKPCGASPKPQKKKAKKATDNGRAEAPSVSKEQVATQPPGDGTCLVEEPAVDVGEVSSEATANGKKRKSKKKKDVSACDASPTRSQDSVPSSTSGSPVPCAAASAEPPSHSHCVGPGTPPTLSPRDMDRCVRTSSDDGDSGPPSRMDDDDGEDELVRRNTIFGPGCFSTEPGGVAKLASNIASLTADELDDIPESDLDTVMELLMASEAAGEVMGPEAAREFTGPEAEKENNGWIMQIPPLKSLRDFLPPGSVPPNASAGLAGGDGANPDPCHRHHVHGLPPVGVPIPDSADYDGQCPSSCSDDEDDHGFCLNEGPHHTFSVNSHPQLSTADFIARPRTLAVSCPSGSCDCTLSAEDMPELTSAANSSADSTPRAPSDAVSSADPDDGGAAGLAFTGAAYSEGVTAKSEQGVTGVTPAEAIVMGLPEGNGVGVIPEEGMTGVTPAEAAVMGLTDSAGVGAMTEGGTGVTPVEAAVMGLTDGEMVSAMAEEVVTAVTCGQAGFLGLPDSKAEGMSAGDAPTGVVDCGEGAVVGLADSDGVIATTGMTSGSEAPQQKRSTEDGDSSAADGTDVPSEIKSVEPDHREAPAGAATRQDVLPTEAEEAASGCGTVADVVHSVTEGVQPELVPNMTNITNGPLVANFAMLGASVAEVINAGADWGDVDIPPSRFIPNLTSGSRVFGLRTEVLNAELAPNMTNTGAGTEGLGAELSLNMADTIDGGTDRLGAELDALLGPDHRSDEEFFAALQDLPDDAGHDMPAATGLASSGAPISAPEKPRKLELGADDVEHMQQLLNQFLAAAGLGDQLKVVPVNPGIVTGGMPMTSASLTDGAVGPLGSAASGDSVQGLSATALRNAGGVCVEGGLPVGARLRLSLAPTHKDVSRGAGNRTPWGPSRRAVPQHALTFSDSGSDDAPCWPPARADELGASVYTGDATGEFAVVTFGLANGTAAFTDGKYRGDGAGRVAACLYNGDSSGPVSGRVRAGDPWHSEGPPISCRIRTGSSTSEEDHIPDTAIPLFGAPTIPGDSCVVSPGTATTASDGAFDHDMLHSTDAMILGSANPSTPPSPNVGVNLWGFAMG